MHLTFDAGAQADQLDFSLSVGGGVAEDKSIGRKPGPTSDTIALEFSGGYPAGRPIALTVTALAGGTPVAIASDQFTAAAGCTARNLTLVHGTPDLGNPDLAGAGSCTLDVDTFEDGCLLAP